MVVYLRDARPQAVTPTRVAIRQVNENFTPRVVAVTVGSEVEFPNEDPIYHNVFSLSRAKNFNLGRYPRGDTRRVRFDSPRVVKVFCEIHSHMSATVMVFDHPWFAVPRLVARTLTVTFVTVAIISATIRQRRRRRRRDPLRRSEVRRIGDEGGVGAQW